MLSKWTSSGDTLSLYQRLTGDFKKPQEPEQLILTLAALLCHERLLPYTSDDIIQPVSGCYLADLDIILSGKSLSNQRSVFKRIGFSFLQDLDTFGDEYKNMFQLLAVALDKDVPSLEAVEGQYGTLRIKNKVSHVSAYNEAMGFALMKTVLELGTDDGSPSRSIDNISEAYSMVELGTDDGSPFKSIDNISEDYFHVASPPKQTRKRRSTGAMRESEEARKKNSTGPQQYSTRSVVCQPADDKTKEPQNDSASTASPPVCLSARSSAQPAIEIDDSAVWDIDAGINWIREKFSELNKERSHKMEALEKHTLSDAIDRNLIRCCRCRSFAATDTEGLCADCFHTRYSECKHPGDLGADSFVLAEEAKTLE